MTGIDRQNHWENIYQTKELTDVSWYQPTPTTSLEFIKDANLDLSARIIDIGGGDSFLVDHLLELGYTNITVMDISRKAIERAKKRLGIKAQNATWVVSDVVDFEPDGKYDLWHDRAAFHFLTKETEVDNYVHKVSNHLAEEGTLVMGTFSEKGPKKCSGIEIKQYSEESISKLFEGFFQIKRSVKIDHPTPFDTLQNFLFCSFKRA